MRHLPAFAFFAAALLGLPTPSPAQQPDPVRELPTDFAALLAKLDACHHPKGSVAPITNYRASLELQLVASTAEQGGLVALEVQFLHWKRPEDGRIRDLLTYRAEASGEPILRGRDRNGYWHLFGGEARDLTSAEFANDLAAAERDCDLARQLLQCLDPAGMLKTMTDVEAVAQEDLQFGREPKVACATVRGRLAAFPLFQQSGDDGAVQLKAFVRQSDHQLTALEVLPLVDGRPESSRSELVRLRDLTEQDGLLMPRCIEHFFRAADGRLRLQSRATLAGLRLAEALQPEAFDRQAALAANQQRRRK